MKQTVFKVILCIVAFVATLAAWQMLTGRGNVKTTQPLDEAYLPVIYMNVNGDDVNTLYGYTADCNYSLFRENITPLDETRGVTFRVVKFDTKVDGINVKVRTKDGSRLIENTDIKNYAEDKYGISASLKLKDLLTDYTEYSLQITLSLSGHGEAVYYTTIVKAPSYCANEKLAYVKNFVEKEKSLETNGVLKEWMESNYLGDNNSLSDVTIHSALSQLSFGNLTVNRETKPVITIKEIASETGIFLVNYVVSTTEDDIVTKYFIEEYFRIKYSPEVTYLLDYNRTMREVTEEEYGITRYQDILLGITDKNLTLIESEDGNIVAFCNENKLYAYNISDSKLISLFSFYDKENFDERTYRHAHTIKPLKVEESGNIWFTVYGYMNRGYYEGRVGIVLYFYDAEQNIYTEQFFISSDESPEMVEQDLNELSYMSNDGNFFFMLDKTIYVVDTKTKKAEIMVSSLEENKYSVSDDSSLMLWIDGEDVDSSEKMYLMNLNTKNITEIVAPDGQYIKPLTFIGDDFAYGLAYKEDVITDSTGRTTFPMHSVKIQSRVGEVLKNYSATGIYSTEVTVEGSMLAIKRVTRNPKKPGEYVAVDSDYISCNKDSRETHNYTDVFLNGDYQKVVRIVLKDKVGKKVTILNPQSAIFEGSGELLIERPKSQLDYYYVYYGGGLRAIYTNEANAVSEANSNYGVVVNSKGYYVWYRANRAARNQIMSMSKAAKEKGVEYNSLTDCMDNIFEYCKVVRNTEYLLSTGETVLSILEDALEGKNVLNLTGCSLDSILYYVNRDIPVLVLMNDDTAKLILGYNSLAVVVYSPDKGTVKLGRKEAESLFSANGNQFITYVPNE